MLKEEKHVFTIYSWKREKDHRQVLIDEASAWLDQDASNQVFFLVPNYSKFEQEQEILAEMRRRSGKKLSAQQTFKYLVFIVWLGICCNRQLFLQEMNYQNQDLQ